MARTILARSVVEGHLRILGTDLLLVVRLDLLDDGMFHWTVEKNGSESVLHLFGKSAYLSVATAVRAMQAEHEDAFTFIGSQVVEYQPLLPVAAQKEGRDV